MRATKKILHKKKKKILKMKDVISKLKSSGVVSCEDAANMQAMITPTLDQIFDRLRASNMKVKNNYPEVNLLFLQNMTAFEI